MNQTRRSKILIVDDVPESALITKALLARGNFKDIDIARGGRDALEKCGVAEDGEDVVEGEVDYQLVILDVMMPDMDGLEVCARMRLSQRTRYLPILMLTATIDVELLNQAFMAGADDFLTKPIDEIRLLARVRTLLRIRREQERRALREEDLRIQNDALRQGQAGMSLIEPQTDLLKRRIFDLIISDCRSQNRSAALSLLQVVDFDAFVALRGEEAADVLTHHLAELLQSIAAPLDILMVSNGPGSFLLIHPGAADAEELEVWNRKARGAVEQAQMVHGNSIQSEYVTLWTTTAWAPPDDLALSADNLVDTTKQILLERQ
ncbi:response regulator [Qipengyuania qiaonensis]|uniref:Response regulator n=1 Tax=Qipengyuania qiaonensis TaxID=2867240 RepID=A0ABS7J0S9_9SPHN|nr:response regulator [Qipengyuania qiaonensis]MBX7480936.1 response regulator [Qipengyuania qiaonensis]